MVITKHSQSHNPKNHNKLDAYVRLAKTYQSDKRTSPLSSRGRFMPLAAAIPLAAIGLAPINGLDAQCVMNSTAVGVPVGLGNPPGANGTIIDVDVDGDGTPDVRFRAFMMNFFVIPLNTNVEILATPALTAMGAGPYSSVPMAAAPLTTGANWQNSGDLIGGQGTMEFGGTFGGWAAGGTGFVGVRVDCGIPVGQKIGFIEVTWSGSGLPTFGGIGVQSDAEAGMDLEMLTCESLPVELTSFTGVIEEGTSKLNWQTASETNNAGFEVQRSIDGVDFQKVGWVEGQGNSLQNINYNFKDSKIQENIVYYYRLKQIDLDGQYALSEIIHLTWKDANAWKVEDVIPNPVNASFARIDIHTSNTANVQLSVYDATGNLASLQQHGLDNGMTSVQLDINGLQAGTYFVKVETDKNVTYKKFIVAR